MTKAPIVSVVMPVFNSERYLREAVDSILSQTYGDFEFIIVDGGSTDGTICLLEEYVGKDSRVRLILLPRDKGGRVDARNAGLRESRGRYIAPMDSDEISLPRRFEVDVGYLETHSDVDVASALVEYVDENGMFLCAMKPYADVNVKDVRHHIPHTSSLIRKTALEALEGYRDDPVLFEDGDLWTRLLSSGRVIHVLPFCLHRYRIHAGEVTIREYAKRAGSAAADQALYNQAQVCLFYGTNAEARRRLGVLVRRSWFNVRFWFYFFVACLPARLTEPFMASVITRAREIVNRAGGVGAP
ncbi:Glycosyltransferase AglE [uncultured archaeon]|nr:Glycosyltransferase AglE [uncultured archaeon]